MGNPEVGNPDYNQNSELRVRCTGSRKVPTKYLQGIYEVSAMYKCLQGTCNVLTSDRMLMTVDSTPT